MPLGRVDIHAPLYSDWRHNKQCFLKLNYEIKVGLVFILMGFVVCLSQ